MTGKRSTLNASRDSAEFFLDTNLIVYAYDAGDPEKRRRARESINVLAISNRGAISTQILGEFYHAVVRKQILPAVEARLVVHGFIRSWRVLEITTSMVAEAMRAASEYQWSYYDAQIWATAKENGIPTVLSEDGQDGQMIEGVRWINPLAASFDMGELE